MENLKIIEEKYAEAVKNIKEEWFNNENTNWYDYVIGLPTQLHITYLTVVLDNQVLNGGFDQYFVNGYGQFAKETIVALAEIGAVKEAQLLKDALSKVNTVNDSDSTFRKRLLNYEIKALFVDDDLSELLHKLDDEYYANEDKDVIFLLGKYLESHL